MGIDHSNPYIHSTTVLCDNLEMGGGVFLNAHPHKLGAAMHGKMDQRKGL